MAGDAYISKLAEERAKKMLAQRIMRTHRQTGTGGLWNDNPEAKPDAEGPRVTSITWENILWMAPLVLVLAFLILLICVKSYRDLSSSFRKASESAVEGDEEAAELCELIKPGLVY